MKNFALALIEGLENVIPNPYSFALAAIRPIIERIELPDGDPKWEHVARVVASTLEDMQAAGELSDDRWDKVRLAAEYRATVELQRLGLLEGV